MENNYPKILSNIPKGQDLFKAGSHENISNAIITLIEKQSKIIDKQIIGLEGDWGTGKSNIIKIIEEKTKDKFLHFTYDTWTHQEDLTRKSILQELITFLKINKIINSNDDLWSRRENELSQKIVSRNTEYFPKIKLYYIFFILAFFVIKFGNEIIKQTIGNKVYGFYDNSLSYLFQNLYFSFKRTINWTYFLKLFPFILIIFGFVFFLVTLIEEIKVNKKRIDNKLTNSQLFGKIFYWVSGERLESNSSETVSEKEPSNQRFRKFLKEIDEELSKKDKKLVFTIDNTDRLVDNKLKNIWSTINIFFAESSNNEYLENIWLIIPYDEKRIKASMEDEGSGLIEKTFAITFKVPPPLLSNWEIFFDTCFKEAFDVVKINNQNEEIQILKRILESYEQNLTPRKIINYVNQLSSYNIQNPSINLRYNAIFILNKDIFFEGNINDNILDRNKYLRGLSPMFIDDGILELSISKIVYGVKSDEEAEESLLSNKIEAILNGAVEIDDKIINTPSFNVYFHKFLKVFITTERTYGDNVLLSVNVTKTLGKIKDSYYDNSNERLFRSMWEDYCMYLLNFKFSDFDETHRNVILFCNKNSSLKFLYSTINSINEISNYREKEKKYVLFLEKFDAFLEEGVNTLHFEDLKIFNFTMDTTVLLDYIKTKRELFSRYKLVTSDTGLNQIFVNKDGGINSIITEYKNEVIILKNKNDMNSIILGIEKSWVNGKFSSVDEINTLMLFYNLFDKKNNIQKLSSSSYSSIINLLNEHEQHEKYYNLYLLLALNYKSEHIRNDQNTLLEILSNLNDEIIYKLEKDILNYSESNNLFNILKIPVELGSGNLKLVHRLSIVILKSKKFILNQDSFKWILSNYSKLVENVFENADVMLYNYLDKHYSGFIIDMPFDENIINSSKKDLNKALLLESEKYFINMSDKTHIFSNENSYDYRLIKKLIENKLLSAELVDILYLPLKNVMDINYKFSPSKFRLILELKKVMDREKIILAVKESVNKPIQRIPNNIVYSIPEIYEVLKDKTSAYTANIINKILKDKDLYTVELIDFLLELNNEVYLSQFKEYLKEINDGEVYDYARQKGLML